MDGQHTNKPESGQRSRTAAGSDPRSVTTGRASVAADDLEDRLGRTRFMQEADVEALCDEAAAEVRRLRAEWEAERALADRLAGALLDGPFRGGPLLRRDRMYGSGWQNVHDTLDEWESRRADDNSKGNPS